LIGAPGMVPQHGEPSLHLFRRRPLLQRSNVRPTGPAVLRNAPGRGHSRKSLSGTYLAW
jgi:hypothetical protein